MCLFSYPRNYPKKFGQKLVNLFEKMSVEKHGMPKLPPSTPTAEATFSSLDFEDLWAEAKMASVCHYLRGGCFLNVPPTFKSLLPRKL